jgi:peptide-methionine (S)-S-oxide reductase
MRAVFVWFLSAFLLAFPAAAQPRTETAIFAGGCFWCMEKPFDDIPGVISTTSGFTGGSVERPSYEQVMTKTTGHVEAVQVVFDPARVTYGRLLAVYWGEIDPTDPDGQFCDRGAPYRTGIFATTTAQLAAANASKAELERRKPFRAPIVTPVRFAGAFWPAEDYHQDYYVKNPARYALYRSGCGRDARLRQLWGPR